MQERKSGRTAGRLVMAGVSALAIAAMGMTADQVLADDYPSKTIEVVTHAGAGGGTDVNSRMMMLRARRTLKTDMVVVNKRGGNGALAMSYFQSRPADGYTIMTFTNGPCAHHGARQVGPQGRGHAPDRPRHQRPAAPDGQLQDHAVQEFRRIPGPACGRPSSSSEPPTSVASTTSPHSSSPSGPERCSRPSFPSRAAGELATQLVAGSIDVGVLNLSEASAQIEAGDICPMVVLHTERMKPIPDVKTAREMGVDVVFATVRGFVTHAGVDDAKAGKLEAGMLKAMGHSIYQAYLTTSGLDNTSVLGSDEWGAQIKQLLQDLIPAAKEMGLVK